MGERKKVSNVFSAGSYVLEKMILTSHFDGKLEMAMGVVRSISPPSISEILSPEKPLVIVVSPVLDL